MDIMFENCAVVSWDQWTDPGDYPSNAGSSPLPPGPKYPEEVEGYAVVALDLDEQRLYDESVEFAKKSGGDFWTELNADDLIHDLRSDAFDFGSELELRCTACEIHPVCHEGLRYLVFIATEVEDDGNEVRVCNNSVEKILADVRSNISQYVAKLKQKKERAA